MTDEQGSILVVDDVAESLRHMTRILRLAGYSPRVADRGSLAIQSALATPPDLVILDMNMPEMSGIEVCRRFKQDERLQSIPIMFLSGLPDGDDKVAAFEAGGIDWVSKPFDEREIVIRVKTHIDMRKLQAKLETRNRQLTSEHIRVSERLDTLSRAARDALIMIDDAGLVIHWNEAAESMFGYTRKEALGRNLHALVAPERLRSLHAVAFPRYTATGQGAAVDKTLELVALRKSGEEFPVELSLATARLEGKRCAIGVVRDISARKKLEEERAFGDLLRATQFEASIDGMLVVNPRGKVVSFNRRFVDMWGIPPDVMAFGSDERTLQSVLDKVVDAAAFVDRVKWLYERPSEHGHDEIELRDGRVFDRHSSPMATPDGKNQGRVWFFRDITESKRLEQRLRASETRLQAILDRLPVGVVIIGRDKTIHFVNEGALTMGKRLSTECLAGARCNRNLCAAPDNDCPILGLDQVVDGVETMLPCSDGSRVPVMATIREVEFDGESVLLKTFVDISARKGLELELAHARKLEAVGQLAAGIAHEINTPTQFVGDSIQFLKEAFSGVGRLLQDYHALTDRVEASGDKNAAIIASVRATEDEIDLAYLLENIPTAIDRCFDGISRIASIVRSMKEFAHADQREQTPGEINRAIENTLTIARNEYKYVANVHKDYGDLPPVVCHLGDLNQVFLNLIVNAAHAIGDVVKASGTKGTISVRTRRESDFVRIDIGDDGAGIPESVRGRVFEPFFTTKPVGKGSGQGLTIARSIVVDKHGGSLTFESAPGKGTTFTIRLPINGKADVQRGAPQ